MNNEVISEIITIQESFHRRILDMRAFERLLNSIEFEESFRNARGNFDELCVLEPIIQFALTEKLKDWIETNKPKVLENMSYRELRKICQQHSVPRWSRLDHSQMVEALRGIQFQPGKKSARRGSSLPDPGRGELEEMLDADG